MRKITISLIVIILFSCGKTPETISQISVEDAPEFFKLADSSATLLVQALGGRLIEVIQTEGVIKAINVCKEEAYEITEDIENEIGNNVLIKRVSNKYRNPKNAPDKFEAKALAWFDEQLNQSGQLPASYGQKIQHKKKVTYRYYKPMKLQTKCLLCHGDSEALLPEIVNRINNLYPDDNATDYQEGDFRGAIRVEMTGKSL